MIFHDKHQFKSNLIWFARLTNNWGIAKKISYSYALALSVACVGTISGFLIAIHYERISQRKLNLSSQQQYLLKKLEEKVTSLRIHPQRLVPVLDSTIWLDYEKNNFLNDVAQINKEIIEIKEFIDEYPDDFVINNQEFYKLLNNYKIKIDLYSQKIQAFWKQIQPYYSTIQKRKTYQEKLLLLLNDKEFINLNVELEKLSDELSLIHQQSEIRKQQANHNFNIAQKLQLQILLGSVLLSGLVAILLAMYTSRAIAKPLLAVTEIAQKITKESNFDLQASVTTDDEVGALAASINQLVVWIRNYINELENIRQNLEQRVEERTSELKQIQQNLEHSVEERTLELRQALQNLKEAQSQLIQTEKMSSLGQMVAGIAHEINNPINFIYGNVECAHQYIENILELVGLYQQQYPNPNPVISDKLEEIDWNYISKDLLKIVSSMQMGTERIRKIVLSLRNFSRLDEAEMKEVNLHEGIENTLLILNYRLKQGIEVIKDYGDLPFVECYPAQLNQVFMNILSNAIDAFLDQHERIDKQIWITTEQVDFYHIKISIRDNGIGIPSDNKKKLFDPFFTTKPVGQGTGLGLSISYKIIEKHQGKIEVFSEVGQGTEFVITIPIKAVESVNNK